MIVYIGCSLLAISMVSIFYYGVREFARRDKKSSLGQQIFEAYQDSEDKK